MQNFKVIPIITRYWRPGHPFIEEVCRTVSPILDDRDIVVFSEKALSVALGYTVDESNLPFSYVSLPLPNPGRLAEKLAETIKKETGKDVGVVIMDSDKVYRLGPLYLSVRSSAYHLYDFGFISYLTGRALKLRRWPTPVSAYNVKIGFEELLEILSECEKAMGEGAGLTVWDMAERFRVGVEEVTWEMLDSIEHKPLALVKLGAE